MSDGSIKFDVKIDNDSFEKDLKSLKNITANVMNDLDAAITGGVLSGIKDMQSVAKSEFAELMNLSEEEKNFLINNSQFAQQTEEERQKNIAQIRSRAYNEENKKLNDNEKKQREIREREFEQLKNSLDVGIISEEQYYLKLRELRDEYFEVGSQEWEKYTVDILKYCKNTSEEIAKTQKKAILDFFSEMSSEVDESFEELETKQKKMSDKLKNFGRLYYENSMNTADGNKLTWMSLGNVERDTQELEEYAAALGKTKDILYKILPVGGEGLSAEELKKNKEYVKEFFSLITEMSVHEGLQFSNFFNNSDEEEQEKYIKSWAKKQDAAKLAAKELYSDEAFEIYGENVGKMAEKVKEKLEEHFGELPDNFFEEGTAAALGFGDGFMQSIEKVFEEIYSNLNEKMQSLHPFVDGISIDRGVVNNNSTSYNIYGGASAKSTALEIYKQNKMERMLVGENL